MPTPPLHKYPRTRHIEGSRLQPGDEDLEAVPFEEIRGRPLVVEEKMDGANCALSFDAGGELLLQSRGHYLTGGGQERHFDLFKRWAHAHVEELRGAIGQRYVVYGEWLYAKHTIYYNHLPHYFMEFDVLDRENEAFLDTPSRARLLEGVPVTPVRVLAGGRFQRPEQLTGLVGPSHFIRDGHLSELRQACERQGLDPERALGETDSSTTMEGLYIKHEEGGVVVGRYKYVRASFLSAVLGAEGHWQRRPIVPNRLREGVALDC
jgi:hypothetical protein